ncbi:hypothetical protein GQ55_6G293100 [Panicum hallii var. hallii]|uniref:t-SNARE coiled-coil homology domain-containing protein n=2 Tax=Panicum hallii TaxID=206008 RepID=A0A2T7DAV2_9POAL|nr:hypothetical protein GQ55_6G293100 [Panicum hallii var. hallii]
MGRNVTDRRVAQLLARPAQQHLLAQLLARPLSLLRLAGREGRRRKAFVRSRRPHAPRRSRPMNSRRDFRSHRAALFDGIEDGGIRAPAYSSREIHEQENDQAMDSLHDRVSILKRLTGDIHEEVENHNRMLDRMGNDMDASRGFLSGTVDRFKMVFETKSSRRMATMVASFIAVFLLIYYLTK